PAAGANCRKVATQETRRALPDSARVGRVSACGAIGIAPGDFRLARFSRSAELESFTLRRHCFRLDSPGNFLRPPSGGGLAWPSLRRPTSGEDAAVGGCA